MGWRKLKSYNATKQKAGNFELGIELGRQTY